MNTTPLLLRFSALYRARHGEIYRVRRADADALAGFLSYSGDDLAEAREQLTRAFEAKREKIGIAALFEWWRDREMNRGSRSRGAGKRGAA